ncbi:DUF2877 domain-containing protein [Candidatus Neomarinimicrobiota bacterium]
MELTSFGDRLARGNYELHSKFDRAVNFFTPDSTASLAAVVNPEIGSGPANIIIRGLDLAKVESLTIADEYLLLDNTRFDLEDSLCFTSTNDTRGGDIAELDRNLPILQACLLETAPPQSLAFLLGDKLGTNFSTVFMKQFVSRIRLGVERLFTADSIGGAKCLRGTGFGLTPSGDDYICGHLIALNLIHKLTGRDLTSTIHAISQVAHGNNPMSNAFLTCAQNGWVSEKFKDLISTLLFYGEEDVCRCARELCAVGATSGTDQAIGFLMTIRGRTLWS